MRFCNANGIPHSEFLDWDAVDRSKAVAYLMEEAERCSMCGTADWEWDEDAKAYTPIEHFCRGCYLEKVYGEGREMKPGTTIRLAKTRSDIVRRLIEMELRFSKE